MKQNYNFRSGNIFLQNRISYRVIKILGYAQTAHMNEGIDFTLKMEINLIIQLVSLNNLHASVTV
jgi:hypothetical protein